MPDLPTNVIGPIRSHISCPHVPCSCSYFPFDALVTYGTTGNLEIVGKENIYWRMEQKFVRLPQILRNCIFVKNASLNWGTR